jgi:hypothetical protein
LATDATGAPTPLGIPKYNTSADAPSGLGFNAAMDALDALISARVTKPVGIATGQIPVWNGSTFVAKNTSQITTSALSGGPPASPSDGDIWIATGVDTNNSRWTFQYNASWVTDANKWAFIGGPSMIVSGAGFTTNGSGAYVSFPIPLAYTAVRGGVYDLISGGFAFTAAGLSSMGLGLHVNGVNQANVSAASNIPSGSAGTLNAIPAAVGATAGQVIELRYFSNVVNSGAYNAIELLPRRIS